MKFTAAVFAAVASLAFVNGQDLTGIPSCALSCFAVAVPASGCSLTDTKCQCTTGQQKITDSVSACVPSKCSAEDQAKLVPAVEALCAKAGITVTNLPTTVPSASGAANNNATVTSTRSSSASATGSGAAQQTTGAAVVNTVGLGSVLAVGLAAVLGL
ncbi:uncharacterized protein BDR25DRAFT_302108 [Lindgomyces ingoldianus]|uniref:Uncharacterized protein n=1 Tax=Lindgomyces ingoldianus TaxID=673940 RepID=A0ACB6R1S6_9PLEO|nr:uncharacterized protein BDR25DRAFT_302108 [Lindgomyces ingoldianus]KAF2473096.1 hypothetical protein BDR25DRAFT_302108 [Lindgomyces ingoldianus]